ncbi:hypothetical protein RHRU231_600020 [Rhodococcus ruber]|uniref:Uncharacterized protein n=1 Tax=Rhodococcus ruber TaxID=1830 RepID=A0A098BPB6_9NOCA|nr:hypothetical protein RHRU231_600020 [Rhodococcus ruber]
MPAPIIAHGTRREPDRVTGEGFFRVRLLRGALPAPSATGPTFLTDFVVLLPRYAGSTVPQ